MDSDLTILFLDFDGVLHPKGCGSAEHFSHLPHFESVVRECPDLRIVISSSWQDAYSLTALRSAFSPDVAVRIIGGTRSADQEGTAEDRHEQIQKYLRKAGVAGVRWLALDDSEYAFPRRCPNLVLCDSTRAFDAVAADELRTRLAAMSRLARVEA